MSSELTPNEPDLAVRTDEYDSHEDSNQNDDLKREVSKDVFTTEAEAEARAEEIGCSGTHSHDDDGNTGSTMFRSHTRNGQRRLCIDKRNGRQVPQRYAKA